MKSSEEVRDLYERLGERPELLDWKAHNFRYGMLLGKLLAIGWVLGEEGSGDVSIDHDFESWSRELSVLGDDIGRRLEE